MRKLSFLWVMVILVAAACSPYNYYNTQSRKADFSQYRTYAWLPGVDSASKSYYNNAIAEENIIETANRELEARGLTHSKENPDLLFRYRAIVNNTSRAVYAPMWGPGWGMGWGWNPWMWHRPWGMGMMGWGGGGAVGTERYRAGHIILEAIDRQTDKVVWQGRGTGEVRNPERAVNQLPQVVTNIMKQYPVTAQK